MKHRGMTLVEVLAATVLLAVLAATIMPALQNALRSLRAPEPPFDQIELVLCSDVLMAEAEDLTSDIEVTDLEFPWPEDLDRPPVVVQRLARSDENHGWLTFSCGPWTVSRWIPVEQDEPDTDEGSEEILP